MQVCDRWPPEHGGTRDRAGGPALSLGLGHRVVAKTAEIHGARFEPWTGPEGTASRYRIVFR